MEKYIGTKVIKAKAMTLGEYNKLRGWEIPEDENPADEGYMVGYPEADGEFSGPLQDGCQHISWSPKHIFESAYKSMAGMSFGLAIEAMKAGHKVARKGWNGANMYVVYQPGYPDGIPINENTAKATGIKQGTECVFRPYLMMKTIVDHEFVPWLASQTDMLAEDWVIV